jgi:hypothetical protein
MRNAKHDVSSATTRHSDGPPKTFLFRCPECGVTDVLANARAKERYEELGRCQGCLAGNTLRDSPHLIPLFIGFWTRNGSPASTSWLAAVPCAGAAPALPS